MLSCLNLAFHCLSMNRDGISRRWNDIRGLLSTPYLVGSRSRFQTTFVLRVTRTFTWTLLSSIKCFELRLLNGVFVDSDSLILLWRTFFFFYSILHQIVDFYFPHRYTGTRNSVFNLNHQVWSDTRSSLALFLRMFIYNVEAEIRKKLYLYRVDRD